MKIIKLDAIDSTNAYLKRLMAANDLGDYTVVVTDDQKEGRGQMGSAWFSEPGKNLTFSVLKKNNPLLTRNPFSLNLITSLAVFNGLRQLEVPRLTVKWPNDILSGNSKICGILIENIISGNTLKASILGIGLNVNQTTFPHPYQASSLKLLMEQTFDLDKLLSHLVSHLERSFDNALTTGLDNLWQSYNNLLFRLGKPSVFKDSDGERFVGIIRGVSEMGKLIVALENGTEREFGFKEVRMLR